MNNDGLELIKRTIADLDEKRMNLGHSNASMPASSIQLQQSCIGFPQATSAEIVKLQSALTFINPDTDRGHGSFFGVNGTPESEIWLATLWAIRSLNWPQGKDIAKNWSKQCPARYSDQGFEDAWNRYNPNHPRHVGIGSLYKFTMHLGWKNQASQVATYYKYKLLTGNDLRAMSPVKWRLKGVFPNEGLAALYGPSASGKSFLALDLSVAFAEGTKWFGIRTTQSRVIYVALEGESGFKNRVAAWEFENQRSLPQDLNMVMQPFHITNPSDLDKFAAAIPIDTVIIVDTLNRAAPTSDENSSKEMGENLQACKRLQRLIGGLVLLVHHTGKDTTKGARGHSSFFAALDGAIEVEKSNDKRSWSIAKAKDGQDGKSFPFSLKLHNLGKDLDGDEITSCTIAQALPNTIVKSLPQGAKQQIALRNLKTEIFANGTYTAGLQRCPPTTKCMCVEDAVIKLAGTLTTTIQSKRKNEARRIVTALIGSGHIDSTIDTRGEAWCWIPI